jgi:hypothetical protein
VDVQFVDETLFEGLPDDVAATHDDDVAVPRSRPRLIDRLAEIVDEADLLPRSRSSRTSAGGLCVNTKNGGVPAWSAP